MGQAVTITNLEHSAADLRRLMSRQKDGAVVRRLIALSLILDGYSRSEAARQSGMERQTLRDWVHRYNGVVSRRSQSRTKRFDRICLGSDIQKSLFPKHHFRQKDMDKWACVRRSAPAVIPVSKLPSHCLRKQTGARSGQCSFIVQDGSFCRS